jgi:SOS-response transcriptional repressor LexA
MQELTETDLGKMDLAERLAALLEEKNGGNQSELARVVDVTPQAVQQWMSGKTAPRGRNLAKVAEFLGVTPAFLQYGERAGTLRVEEAPFPRYSGTVQEGPPLRGRVPLISWVQAGNFQSAVDNLHPGDADEWAETTVPIHKHTYALRVNGDSMTSPAGEPSFPHGCIIIIEPDAIDSPDRMVGRFVIVKRTDHGGEATFKQLVKDAGRFYLKPLNPQYQMMELDAEDVFCGVVRERVTRFF